MSGKETTPVVIRQDGYGKPFNEDYYGNGNVIDIDMDKVPHDPITPDPAELLRTTLKDGPLDSRTVYEVANRNGFNMQAMFRIRTTAGVLLERQSD